MVQHSSYNIPDQSGTSFRADLNIYLKAILSSNSGPTEPTNPLVGMLWYDDVNHFIKVRNSTNTAWTTVANSVTGEVSSVTNTNSATTVNGFPADIEVVPDTIVQRGTETIPGGSTAAIKANIIGNATQGNAATIGGFTNTDLKNMDNVTNREYITVSPGDFVITGNVLSPPNLSGGWPGILWTDYKIPFSGGYRLFVWVRDPNSSNIAINGIRVSAGSQGEVLRLYNKATTAIIPSGLGYTFTNNSWSFFKLDILNLNAGDLITAELLGTSLYSTSIYWSLGTAEFGIEIIANTGAGNDAGYHRLSRGPNCHLELL